MDAFDSLPRTAVDACSLGCATPFRSRDNDGVAQPTLAHKSLYYAESELKQMMHVPHKYVSWKLMRTHIADCDLFIASQYAHSLKISFLSECSHIDKDDMRS